MDKGQLVNAEARFNLAKKNYSRPFDRQFARSLEPFREGERLYPHNPLWELLVAGVELRMGNAREGEALYRRVIAETAHPRSELWNPLHQLSPAAALARRSGN